MKRWLRPLGLLMLSLGLGASVDAEIDFFSYQKTRQIMFDDTGKIYYDTNFALIQLGTAQLEESQITVAPRGAYLDIVEDAWISSNLTVVNAPNLINSFLFQGSITLPPRATVTGMETWKGDTMYFCKLHQMQYSYNAVLPDSASIQSMLDSHIATIKQVTPTTYELLFARVSLGERKHIRVRYVLPNSGNGNTPYEIPVLFDPGYTVTPPAYIKLNVLANATNNAYYLSTRASPVQLKDSITIMIPYQPVIELTYLPKAQSVMHLTSFAQGTWAGNYTLLNTVLTDSTIGKLSKTIQTVFIWRWNAPSQIVTFNGSLKGLSPYGTAVIGQARALAQTIKALQKRGNKCALLHTIEGSSGYAYETSAMSDSSSSRILSYLGTFNETALYNAYVNQGSPVPDWVPIAGTSSSAIELAQHDFLAQLRQASALLKDTTVAYRHIVLVTVGDASSSFSTDYSDNIDSILASISIDAANAQWRGADMFGSLSQVSDQSLVPWQSFNFPAFAPLTVQLTIRTSEHPYAFSFTTDGDSNFATTARTSGVMDSVFTWEGFDQKGKETFSITTQPLVIRAPADSGVAKIWAHDDSHVSEVEEPYPGGTFGIVTKSTFLQATLQDTSTVASGTVPFLADYQILAQKSSVRTVLPHTTAGLKISFRDGILSLANAGDLRRLDIYDLSGRLLASVDLRAWSTGSGSYRVALRSLIRLAGHRVFIVRITGPSFMRVFKLTAGGIL